MAVRGSKEQSSGTPETISPTRLAEGVTTAPLVSAEQEIAQLRAELHRLRLTGPQPRTDDGRAPAAAEQTMWPECGLKITYGKNASPHPSTATIMRDRFREESICPSSDFGYLPQPTTDGDQLEHDFVRWGYCIVADAMTSDQVDRVVSRLKDQAAAERAAGVAHVSHGGSSQHVFNTLPKGKEFRDMIEFHPRAAVGGPTVEGLLEKILGRGWYGGTFHGSIVHEGGGDQGMHQDQGEIPIDLHANVPMKCLIIWTLSEFNLEMGGTYMVPGSHRDAAGSNRVVPSIDYTELANGGEHGPGLVACCAPPGSAILTDSRLLHSGARRTAPGTRYALRYLYQRGFIRQQENQYVSVPDEIVSVCSPKLLKMMGYQSFGGLGMVNGYTSNGKRPAVPIGELSMARPEEFGQDFDEKYSMEVSPYGNTRPPRLLVSCAVSKQ
eukprot:COSAG02_NODE_461_length_21848_cov_235.681043_9_plen_439_part_00